MDATRLAQRHFEGAALSATLWHPYLGLALHNLFGRALPSYAGSLSLLAAAIAVAWLLCFSAERFLAPLAPSRFLHVDAVMQDPSLSLAEKLRGVASSWVGRALLASFVVCVGVLALAIVRAIAG